MPSGGRNRRTIRANKNNATPLDLIDCDSLSLDSVELKNNFSHTPAYRCHEIQQVANCGVDRVRYCMWVADRVVGAKLLAIGLC